MEYLDYNATTPVDPAVLQEMLPYLSGGIDGGFGNPSSSYGLGHAAHEAVATARARVAALLGCAPESIVFTGGGSEADNLALKGVAERAVGCHVVVSAVEHPAVLEVCAYLARRGFRVTVVPVDSTGLVDPDDVARAIEPDTRVVSVMHANNEVGTIQPDRVDPSPVLKAMGVSDAVARGAVRLSLGRYSTEAGVDRAAEALIRGARTLRGETVEAGG